MNSKVIKMGSNNMGRLIEAAKKQAEIEYQERVERSRECDVDVRDFFTTEELDRILSDDYFNGKVADLSVMQRYEKVKQVALWLDTHCMEIVSVEIEPVSRSRPNAIICVDIRRLASLRGKELRAFNAMGVLADSMFLSGLKDETIRFTFGFEGVWQ